MHYMLSQLLCDISSDPDRSVFFVEPVNLTVLVASQRALDQYRKLGFGGKRIIIGLTVSHLYRKSAQRLFHDDRRTARDFVRQQEQTWNLIRSNGSYKQETCHFIKKGDKGQEIKLIFHRVESTWSNVLGYIVEVKKLGEISDSQYDEKKAHRELLYPHPDEQIA